MHNRQPAPDAVWLTRVQLADRTGFKEATLRNWGYRGHGPKFSKFGHRVRYRLDHVLEWEAAQGIQADSRAA